MGTTNLILAICVLAAIALQFYFSNKRKLQKKKVLTELTDYAAEHGGAISRHFEWSNTLIGIDETASKKIFFIRKRPDKEVRKAIDLYDISKCRVDTVSRTAGEGKNRQTVIDHVALAITYYDKTRPEDLLEFYNNDYDGFTLNGELQWAEKWSYIINTSLFK